MRFPGDRLVPVVLAGMALMLLGGSPPQPASAAADGVCALASPPEYYKIKLVPTRRVPAARRARGAAHVNFAASPFGISVSAKGNYVYDLSIVIDDLKPAPEGVYVAWLSTPNLDQVVRLGPLDAQMRASGRVTWNKYLVIITLEPSADTLGDIWQGPVVMRGMSRSGLMHTMAGHGPFQQEPCATFGYY